MFEIELFDQSGEKLVSKEFALPGLPIVSQKVVLKEQGEFEVNEVVILIDEQSPNVPKYKVILRRLEMSSRADNTWLGKL